MTAKKAIAVVGYPGAGKSTAGRILSTGLSGIHIETGDVVRAGAVEYYDVDGTEELSSEQLGQYSTMRRRDDGGDYVAQDVIDQLERMENFPRETAVIVGMRDTAVPELFDEYFDDFVTVWVHATFETRLERLQERGRNGEDTFTEDDLKYRDGRENMWGTAECAFQADLRVMNEKSIEELRHSLFDVFRPEEGVW